MNGYELINNSDNRKDLKENHNIIKIDEDIISKKKIGNIKRFYLFNFNTCLLFLILLLLIIFSSIIFFLKNNKYNIISKINK